MRFLLTGGTGFVGSHLADFLSGRGDEVTCVVRNTGRLRYLDRKKVVLLTFPQLWESIRAGASYDYVLHTAGATRALSYDEYAHANVDLTRDLLAAFSQSESRPGLQKFVLVSSQAAAGPCGEDGLPVSETDALKPVSDYGRSKLAAEELTLGYSKRLPITIVRPSAVFGPRDVDMFTIFRMANFRFVPILSGPTRTLSIIYVNDLVEGIVAAAESKIALGQTYFLANLEPVIWADLVKMIAELVNGRVLTIPIPLDFMKFITSVGDIAGKLTRKPTFLRSDKFNEIKELAWVCSAEKARNELGWTAKTPIKAAVRYTADWYKSQGWL